MARLTTGACEGVAMEEKSGWYGDWVEVEGEVCAGVVEVEVCALAIFCVAVQRAAAAARNSAAAALRKSARAEREIAAVIFICWWWNYSEIMRNGAKFE